MKKPRTFVTAGLVASVSLMLCVSSAIAHEQVNWSITAGSRNNVTSEVYSQPQVIYAQPRVLNSERATLAQYRGEPHYGHREHQWRELESDKRHEVRHHEPYAYRHHGD